MRQLLYFQCSWWCCLTRNNWVCWLLIYRSQMQTIVTKACKELDIKPIPSKRVCIMVLVSWHFFIFWWSNSANRMWKISTNLWTCRFSSAINSSIIKLCSVDRQKLQAWLTMSDLEQLRPCESADIYNAAPHNPLGLLPVCKSISIFIRKHYTQWIIDR